MRGDLTLLRETMAELIAIQSPPDQAAMMGLASLWPAGHQRAPESDWATWVLMGGRGAGKTHAGAWWLNALADSAEESGRALRLALVAPTLHDVREVMVEGPSGLIALADPEKRPRWEQSRRRLVWPGGTMAQGFSAEDPDSLRGPQFDAAWADEFCAWREPERVLEMLRLGLRLGEQPRLTVTTTPRPTAALRRLIAEPTTEVSRGGTAANAANLSPGFVENLRRLYGGTWLESQELDGLIVEETGGLFRQEDMRRARERGRAPQPASWDRIVVAVDPPISERGDACGVVAAARSGEMIWVLADRSARGCRPLEWAGVVMRCAAAWDADLVVAEANQGGEMVRAVLTGAGCTRPIKLVHATVGKRTRAEPAALLYEQGRVAHMEAFPELEAELTALGGRDAPSRSPDRADALVWAVTELTRGGEGPRVRVV